MQKTDKSKVIWISMIVLLFLVSFIALFIGRFTVNPKEVIEILINKISGVDQSGMAPNIVLKIRFPRVILTMLVGAGLAISGCTLQGIFQNPLVSPDVLSVSSGSAFGAVLGILISGSNTVITVLALLFGLISVAITYNLSKIGDENTTLSLVLSGMVMSAAFNALVSLMKYVANTDTQLPAITYWLMGSFSDTTFSKVKIAIIPIVAGSIVLFLMRYKMNILSLGDDEAYSLGVNPRKDRFILIVASTLVTSACITVTGIIGWVGLVIPHISRMLVGVNHSKLLPMTIIIGAIFMTTIDVVARTVCAVEIPVGILTALIGAPFFIIIFKKSRGKMS